MTKGLNINYINMHQINSISLVHGGGNDGLRPWEKYSQDGLIFQLDCGYGTNATSGKWKDIIEGYEASITQMEIMTDGGVKGSCSEYSKKTWENVSVEIVYKESADGDLKHTYYSGSGALVFGSGNNITYAFRVYQTAKYSDAVKASNATIDAARFASKQFTLDDSLLDSNDWLG